MALNLLEIVSVMRKIHNCHDIAAGFIEFTYKREIKWNEVDEYMSMMDEADKTLTLRLLLSICVQRNKLLA
jgi:hypothetical protein